MKRYLPLILILALIIPHSSFSQNCLLAHFPLDGNANDVSGNNVPAVVNGPVAAMDRFGNPNGAMRFDGVDDFIELNNDAALIDSGAFTISIWAKMTGQGGGVDNTNPMFQQRADGTSNGTSKLVLFAERQNNEIALVAIDEVGSSVSVISNPKVTDTAWHCYTFVHTASNYMYLYLDGILVSQGPSTESGFFNVGINHVTIGSHNYLGQLQGAFNGCIDEVKIYNCELDSSEIVAACFEQSSNNDTACLLADYRLDGNGADSSGNGLNGTVYGPVPTMDRFGNAGGAMKFDGIDDYIELNNNQAILDSGAFTVLAYAKILGQGGGVDNTNPIFQQRADGTSAGTSKMVLFGERQNSEMALTLFDEVGASGSVIDYPKVQDTNWHCYAFVNTGNNWMYIYLDGIQVAQGPSAENGFFDVNIDHVTIGTHNYLGQLQGAFNGCIDDVKIYQCALDSAEIAAMCPAQSIGCTYSQYDMFNSALDVSGNGYDGMFSGPPTSVTGFNGSPNGAYRFDAQNDFVVLNNNQPVIPNDDFTIVVQASINGVAGGVEKKQILFSQNNILSTTGSSIQAYADDRNNVRLFLRDDNGVTTTISGPAPVDNDWHCFGFTRRSDDSCFVSLDGVIIGQGVTNDAGTYTTGVNSVNIAMHNSQGSYMSLFNGDIDDVKIYRCSIPNDSIQVLCKGLHSGIEDLNINSNLISIYPNPASDYLQVKIHSEAHDMEALSFSVVDAIGQELQLQPEGERLNVAPLARGVYLLIVRDETGAILGSKQFLK